MAIWTTWTLEVRLAAVSVVISLVALATSIGLGYLTWDQSSEAIRLSRETNENEYRKKPTLTIALGRDVFLAAKPYVGVMVSVNNSGAQTGVVARGSMLFDAHTLELVMMSPQTESWTYGPKRDEIPMRFSYFAPIMIGKAASISSVLWFQRDMGSTRLFTAGRHVLELRLYSDVGAESVAEKRFEISLTDHDVAFLYRKGNEATQLPVVARPVQ